MLKQYEPGKNDIYTFMDCPDAYPIYWINDEKLEIHRCQGVKRSLMDCCESMVDKGKCPRGFTR